MVLVYNEPGVHGQPGTANTGGGGGGGGTPAGPPPFQYGGNGGSGVVIIQYPNAVANNDIITGGCRTTVGCNVQHRFNATGCFVVP
jgi:hypothetical protein